MYLRKDDQVQILTGDDAGKTGRILRVLPDENKIVVEGVNRVYRHLKPNRRNAQGGRLSREMPVDASNVALVCPTCRRGTRIGRRYTADGVKQRYCKNCGNEYPGKPLSKSRKSYAR